MPRRVRSPVTWPVFAEFVRDEVAVKRISGKLSLSKYLPSVASVSSHSGSPVETVFGSIRISKALFVGSVGSKSKAPVIPSNRAV